MASTRRVSRLAAALTLLLSFALVQGLVQAAVAQQADPPGSKRDEADDKSTSGNPAETFAERLAQWNELNQKLDSALDKFRQAKATERQEPYREYMQLVTEANRLLPELRKAAIAAYRQAPNGDQRVVTTLIGMMANHNRREDYDLALEVGRLLLENKCDAPALQGQMGIALFFRGDFPAAAEYLKAAGRSGPPSESLQLCIDEMQRREAEAAADDLPRVRITTTKGDIVVELYENEAPQTVGNFIHLAEQKFYDGTTFHRVIPGFVAQGGCPKGDGTGGPGYEIYCECGQENARHHFRGVLSMAHSGRDTGGSQFFITYRRTSHLDGKHTVFGRVIEGMDVVDKLQSTDSTDAVPDKMLKLEVIRKRDHEYTPTKVKS